MGFKCASLKKMMRNVWVLKKAKKMSINKNQVQAEEEVNSHHHKDDTKANLLNVLCWMIAVGIMLWSC